MNVQLHDELVERMNHEQGLRMELTSKPDDIQLMLQMVIADAQNTLWLIGIIDQYGFPGKSLAGEDGTKAAWLIIQHSPAPQFQKKCLPLLEEAVRQNEADPKDLAYPYRSHPRSGWKSSILWLTREGGKRQDRSLPNRR